MMAQVCIGTRWSLQICFVAREILTCPSQAAARYHGTCMAHCQPEALTAMSWRLASCQRPPKEDASLNLAQHSGDAIGTTSPSLLMPVASKHYIICRTPYFTAAIVFAAFNPWSL